MMDYSLESVVREFSYTWPIHVKDLFTDHDIYSPTFHSPEHETGIWSLEIIGCQDSNGELCVRLGIRLQKAPTPINGRARVSIYGTEFQSSEVETDFHPIEPSEVASITYNLPLHVITKWANGKVDDQNLVVNLHMWLWLPSITVPMVNVQTDADKVVVKKLEREDLWETPARLAWGCDVTIRCLHQAVQRHRPDSGHDRVTWSGQSEQVVAGSKIARDVIENGTSKFINFCKSEGNTGRIKPSLSSMLIRRRESGSRICGRCPSSGSSPVRGINAVRAGFLSAREAESLGLGRMSRRGGSEGDSMSVIDQDISDDRSIDGDASPSNPGACRGWHIDPFGPSDITPATKHDRGAMDSSSSSRQHSPSPHLFREGNYADFKVHRTMLCMRSPVFRQMLSDESLDFIEVVDTDSAVMEQLLRFIYTGAASKDTLPALSEGLLTAASKYEILHLKAQCEEVLITTLTPENSCRILAMADKNQAQTLKEGVYKYALKEFREIFRTPEFRQFRAEQSSLANEFLMSIFSRSSASHL